MRRAGYLGAGGPRAAPDVMLSRGMQPRDVTSSPLWGPPAPYGQVYGPRHPKVRLRVRTKGVSEGAFPSWAAWLWAKSDSESWEGRWDHLPGLGPLASGGQGRGAQQAHEGAPAPPHSVCVH